MRSYSTWIKKGFLLGLFLIIYVCYFIYYNDDSIKNTLCSTYALIVGNSIGVMFIIPVYIYTLVNETKSFFNINVLTRFDSYDQWWNKVAIKIITHVFSFIFILNISYILSVIIGGDYTIDIDSILYILEVSIIQFLILTSIGMITQIFMFLWENKYIAFSVTYSFILFQYGSIRIFRLPKEFTIVDLIFVDPILLNKWYLIRNICIFVSLIIFIYFSINLLITKRDVLWGEHK